jgi:hypothetical protein
VATPIPIAASIGKITLRSVCTAFLPFREYAFKLFALILVVNFKFKKVTHTRLQFVPELVLGNRLLRRVTAVSKKTPAATAVILCDVPLPYVDLMPHGAYSLRDLPGPYVELACSKCERHGRLRRDKLMAQYGAEIGLPDLRGKLARASKCERVGNMYDARGAHYPALKPARP